MVYAAPGQDAGGVPDEYVESLMIIEHALQKFRIVELKRVLRGANLSLTGAKADLKERIKEYFYLLCDTNDSSGISELQALCEAASAAMTDPQRDAAVAALIARGATVREIIQLQNSTGPLPAAQPSGGRPPPQTRSQPAQPAAPVARNTGANGTIPMFPDPAPRIKNLKFRPSPFYRLIEQVHPPLLFKTPHMRERLQRTISFKMNWNLLQNRRLFLMCQEIGVPGAEEPIYYPYNNEIFFNGMHVPANTRGVKGRAGSARPADLTARLIGREEAPQRTQALTVGIHVSMRDPSMDDYTLKKSFAFASFIGEYIPVAEILAQIKKRPKIPRSVVQKLIQTHYADEEDLGTEEAVYSLMDQVALCRIQTPVRSTLCNHVECFDGEAFIQLQEQAETWRCPNCDKDITFESLAVDEYFEEVIEKATPDARQIVVEKDGAWNFKKEESEPESDSDDDEPPQRQFKRLRRAPEVTVIDLTQSDDEDPPPRQLALPAPPTHQLTLPGPPSRQLTLPGPVIPQQPPQASCASEEGHRPAPPARLNSPHGQTGQGGHDRASNQANGQASTSPPTPVARALARVIGSSPQAPQTPLGATIGPAPAAAPAYGQHPASYASTALVPAGQNGAVAAVSHPHSVATGPAVSHPPSVATGPGGGRSSVTPEVSRRSSDLQPTPVLTRAAALARSRLFSQSQEARQPWQAPWRMPTGSIRADTVSQAAAGVAPSRSNAAAMPSRPEASAAAARPNAGVQASGPGGGVGVPTSQTDPSLEQRLMRILPQRPDSSSSDARSPDLFQPQTPVNTAAPTTSIQTFPSLVSGPPAPSAATSTQPSGRTTVQPAAQPLNSGAASAAPRNDADEANHFRMTFSKAKSTLFGVLSAESRETTSPGSVETRRSSESSETSPEDRAKQAPGALALVRPQRSAGPPPSYTGEVIDLTNDDDD